MAQMARAPFVRGTRGSGRINSARSGKSGKSTDEGKGCGSPPLSSTERLTRTPQPCNVMDGLCRRIVDDPAKPGVRRGAKPLATTGGPMSEAATRTRTARGEAPRYDMAAFRREVGDVPLIDDERVVRLRS